MKSISLSLHAYNYSYILLQSNSQDSFAGLLRVTTYSSSFFVSSVRLSSKCQSSLACSEAGNPVGPLTPKGVSWRRRVDCEAALQKVCGGWGEVGDSQNWAVPIFFCGMHENFWFRLTKRMIVCVFFQAEGVEASVFPSQVRGPSENHAGHWERWQSCEAAWMSWGQGTPVSCLVASPCRERLCHPRVHIYRISWVSFQRKVVYK